MEKQHFSTAYLVEQTPKEIFKAINNVQEWWTENLTGKTHQLDDEFEVHFGEVHYSKQKLVELVPFQKIVWLVTDSRLNFVKDQSEWNNTKIVFDIAEKDGGTQLRFTHVGLVPAYECYSACSNAWSDYINNSLHSLITTGKGQPTPRDAAEKAAE